MRLLTKIECTHTGGATFNDYQLALILAGLPPHLIKEQLKIRMLMEGAALGAITGGLGAHLGISALFTNEIVIFCATTLGISFGLIAIPVALSYALDY